MFYAYLSQLLHYERQTHIQQMSKCGTCVGHGQWTLAKLILGYILYCESFRARAMLVTSDKCIWNRVWDLSQYSI